MKKSTPRRAHWWIVKKESDGSTGDDLYVAQFFANTELVMFAAMKCTIN